VTRIELAAAIGSAARIGGRFRLRSGAEATEYFDKYQFESDPVLLTAIINELAALVPPSTDVLAGLELGGIPLVTALSLHTGLPCAFVRRRAKEYGTCRLAEGADVAGRRLLVVEDVITTGGQVISSCGDLRGLDAIVEHAVCVIDRCSGGRELLRTAGVELHALFVKGELESVDTNAGTCGVVVPVTVE